MIIYKIERDKLNVQNRKIVKKINRNGRQLKSTPVAIIVSLRQIQPFPVMLRWFDRLSLRTQQRDESRMVSDLEFKGELIDRRIPR